MLRKSITCIVLVTIMRSLHADEERHDLMPCYKFRFTQMSGASG
jgi:hypothetical protein